MAEEIMMTVMGEIEGEIYDIILNEYIKYDI
jgi:hypothetical protein